jgi:ABC-2 type transport system permease protein
LKAASGKQYEADGKPMKMTKKKQNIRLNNILQLLLSLVIIAVLNIIGSYEFARFDLTTEKRYTLSDATRRMLRELDDIVYFRIYLDGEFPAGFKRLRNATREMLDEFRAYSDNIQYEFINPSASDNQAERNALYEELVREGLNPTELFVTTSEGRKQQLIFPGAVVSYKQRKIPLHLLASSPGSQPEQTLNQSVQNLEYNISRVISRFVEEAKPGIAFIEGNGELDDIFLAGAMDALQEYYEIERVEIDGKINSLTQRTEIDSLNYRISNKYEAVIIAKPMKPFSERDKFIIDQYIMHGGKLLWFIDPVLASMDSLQNNNQTIGISNDVNLSDQLFRYGVRLNNNLIRDLQALPIPIVTGSVGGQPQTSFLSWDFFPVLIPRVTHPIVATTDAVMGHFVSTIDLIETQEIEKTILLTSSEYSRVVNTPVLISLDILHHEPDQSQYRHSFQPVAVLLEGEFESLYKNRIPPEIMHDRGISFRESSVPTAMLVVSDGDIVRNQVHFSQGNPLPLGYDQYTRQQFGNRDFLLNAVNYLCDDQGVIAVRSREIKLRLLDGLRIRNNKVFWQTFNTLTPVALVIIFGLVRFIIRKRKYTS